MAPVRILLSNADSMSFHTTRGCSVITSYSIHYTKLYESDYPTNNRFGIIPNMKNKKKVGIMKDECCPKVMTEFAGLRSKCYSVRVEGEDAIKNPKASKVMSLKQP